MDDKPHSVERGLTEITGKSLNGILSPETVTDLEYVMTTSAFGYEYAKVALKNEGHFSAQSERLLNEMDSHKQTYFFARAKLQGLDENRVYQLERDLKVQKLLVFPEPVQLLN